MPILSTRAGVLARLRALELSRTVKLINDMCRFRNYKVPHCPVDLSVRWRVVYSTGHKIQKAAVDHSSIYMQGLVIVHLAAYKGVQGIDIRAQGNNDTVAGSAFESV